MIAFDDLGLTLNDKVVDFKIGEDTIVSVRQYLPVEEKTELLQYVINASLDDSTGCFSPLRVEIYFALGVCNWYTDIEIDSLADAGKTYDLLECNGILGQIFNNIPKEELEFIRDLVNDTTVDIARYNSSAAGIIQSMNSNAGDLDTQLSNILEKIRDKDGVDAFKTIKDMVGTD